MLNKYSFQAAISDDESPPATLTPHPPKVLITTAITIILTPSTTITTIIIIECVFSAEHSCLGPPLELALAHGGDLIFNLI